MSYSYSRQLFHYIVDNGIVFMCVAGEDFGRRIPFAFLEEIKSQWFETYGQRGQSALDHGMNQDFARVLQTKMDYFSNNPEADLINKVRGEMESVKAIMVDNVDKVLKHGEKIELLVDESENLHHQSYRFKKESTKLKQAMMWKNIKMGLILAAIVILIIYMIVAAACGGLTMPRCKKSNNNSTKFVADFINAVSYYPKLHVFPGSNVLSLSVSIFRNIYKYLS